MSGRDKLKAIPTLYSGVMFRSRLEARWAVYFDTLGIPWEYEPEQFKLCTGEQYIPDFRFGPTGDVTSSYFAEVKPHGDPFSKSRLLAARIVLLSGPPELPCIYELSLIEHTATMYMGCPVQIMPLSDRMPELLRQEAGRQRYTFTKNAVMRARSERFGAYDDHPVARYTPVDFVKEHGISEHEPLGWLFDLCRSKTEFRHVFDRAPFFHNCPACAYPPCRHGIECGHAEDCSFRLAHTRFYGPVPSCPDRPDRSFKFPRLVVR